MTHPFVDSGRRELGPSGRSYAICETCGRKRIGVAHGRVDHRAPKTNPARRARIAASPPRTAREPLPPPPRPLAPQPLKLTAPPPLRVADWRLSLLRLALDQALEGPTLAAVTRLKLEDARRALRSELFGQVATADQRYGPELAPNVRAAQALNVAEPVIPAPEPIPERTRPAREPDDRPTVSLAATSRQARAFRGDKQRELFLRAVRAGWEWRATGNGHVMLTGPAGTHVTVSTTAIADRGHGWRNLRASAKRAGLNVDGL